MITEEMCKLDCHRSLLSPCYWQEVGGEADSLLWTQPPMPQWLGPCTNRDWLPVRSVCSAAVSELPGWHCSCRKAGFPGHKFSHLSEGAQQQKDGSPKQRVVSKSKRERSTDKGGDWQARERGARAGCLLPCHSVSPARERGTELGFLFCFVIYLREGRHSKFDQIFLKWSEDDCRSNTVIGRNMTFTDVHSTLLFSGVFEKPRIMHHTHNFMSMSLRLR